jgi:hypothetical protein
MSSHSFGRLVSGVARASLLVLAALIACDSPTVPDLPDLPAEAGAIAVITATTGADIPSNFGLQINSAQLDAGPLSRALQPNDRVVVEKLKAGNYVVSLSFLPANCSSVQNPQHVKVEPGVTASVKFNVRCILTYGAITAS